MLNRKLILTLVTPFLLFASQAQAGVLSSATWTGDFQGVPFTLVIGDGTVGGVPSHLVELTASGTNVGANANVSVSVRSFTASVTVPPPPVTFTPPPDALTISQMLGGHQVIAVNGGTAMAAGGVGALGSVNFFLNLVGTPLFFLGVPLNVGGIGTQMRSGFNPLVTHVSVTATFLGWQIDPFTVTGLTNQGIALPDAMFTGTNMLVNRGQGGGAGTVTLVSPAVVAICAGGGTTTPGTCTGASQLSRTASATTLKLRFVPEPGVLLLLGAGLAGLAIVGRRSH